MSKAIRIFMLFEGATFIAAALTHFGVLMHGYEHQAAGIAETVIGSELLIGFAWSWIQPQLVRSIGLVAQEFALLGTFVGIYTIIIGIGPQTVPDVAYHIFIVIVLVSGLITAVRMRKLPHSTTSRAG